MLWLLSAALVTLFAPQIIAYLRTWIWQTD